MEKILNIDGRNIKFKSTGAFLFRYKAQFGRDALKDIYKLQDAVGENNKIVNIEALDLEVFYNLVWTLAKTADSSISTPIEWLDGFSEFPLMEILPELIDMIFSCLTSTVQSKKKSIDNTEDDTSFELTTEVLMLRAIERGLSLSDFTEMTVGMILGYIVAFNNEHLGEDEKEDSIRIADQSDFDKF